MTVPALPPLSGTIRDISPVVKYSPYTGNWWTQSVIERVPEVSIGWLASQGWQVTSSYVEEACGQTFYTMARQSMNSWMILQSLLREYTVAYNEGRAANSIRYNDIIDMWVNALSVTRETVDSIGDISDGHVSLYVTTMDSLVTDIENEMALLKTEADDAVTEIDTQLTLYLARVNTLEATYTAHKTTAEGYLTGLGTTELARINELFDNQLAKVKQDMVNRGLYSSVLYSTFSTRIERERNEAIAALNDKLNREKLENEHLLYGQDMSNKGLVLDGRMKHIQGMMQKTGFLVDTRHKIAMTVMEARLKKAMSRMDIRDREQQLMSYQLDTHNNMAVGLWSFIERRTDEYPSMESISQLVAGLGDAGGGWLTPN